MSQQRKSEIGSYVNNKDRSLVMFKVSDSDFVILTDVIWFLVIQGRLRGGEITEI